MIRYTTRLPKRIRDTVEPIGLCGHTHGACTCDFFAIDVDSTRDRFDDLEDGYQEYLENKGKE